jgi:hypothetical protein
MEIEKTYIIYEKERKKKWKKQFMSLHSSKIAIIVWR